jgi:enamine deaminase RidA (YjgF/YER057c/UK114 family)
MSRQHFPAHPEVPISRAVRAGDFIYTSGFGPWTFDPRAVSFTADGTILDDGSGRRGVPFEEQVHLTFAALHAALAVAGAELADVIDCQVWLADPRDFVRFNEIYVTYFKENAPARTVFPSGFMFCCLIEMKMIAYKPLMRGPS